MCATVRNIISLFSRFALAGLLIIMSSSAVIYANPIAETQVYLGEADDWPGLINGSEQWKFVREHADGYYTNFIVMDWATSNENLKKTKALMKSKNIYFESDMNNPVSKDSSMMAAMHAAGYWIPMTSLNYGWTLARHNILKNYVPDSAGTRYCVVQNGPWTFNGNVLTSGTYCSNVAKADGLSTDGPMGFWLTDYSKMRAGSYSMVKYAHSIDKIAMAMLAPYGANQSGYNASKWLSTGIDCVLKHEANNAVPDIWAIWEYAMVNFPVVPECNPDSSAANTVTGMAYWVIRHLQGKWASLKPVAENGLIIEGDTLQDSTTISRASINMSASGNLIITYKLANSSTWCDMSPVLSAKVSDTTQYASIKFAIDGMDTTARLLSDSGVACVGSLNLAPGTSRNITITIEPKTPSVVNPKSVEITMTLNPNPGRRKTVLQKAILQINAFSTRAEQSATHVKANAPLNLNITTPTTNGIRVSFSLASTEMVSLEILDCLGKKVDVLSQNRLAAGNHIRTFQVTRPSGIYYCRLNAGCFSDIKRFALVR